MPFVTLSNSIQYIIGIDFGNGETSAADCNLNNTNLPEDLKFMNNSTIATAISVNTNGEVRLGFDTLNEDNPDQFGAYLKGRPSDLDRKPAQKELYKKFITEIYDNIKQAMQCEGKNLTPYNHLVFVACPSMSKDWDEKEKKKYAEFMAEECGLPILKHSVFGVEEYGVFRESRAAYVKYKGSDEAKNNEDNILVIDFGSSTVDMTYHSKSDKPIDKGYTTIGAQRVEELMTEWSMSSKNIDTEDGRRSLLRELYEDMDGKGWKEYIKLAVRKSKEEYYSGNPNEVEMSIRPGRITKNPALPKIEIEIPRDVVDNDVLSGYKKDIMSCFDDFKKEHLQGKPISVIVLTGGASRMMWIEDIIKESFPNVKLYHPKKDKATSLLVSNGIAIAGRVEVKMIQMLRQLRSEISTIKIDGTFEFVEVNNEKQKQLINKDAEPLQENDSKIKYTFVDYLTNRIVDEVIKISEEVYAEVAVPDSQYNTFNKIKARLVSKMAYLNEKWVSDVISEAVGTCHKKYSNDYETRLQKLCESYFNGVDIALYQAKEFRTEGDLVSNNVINDVIDLPTLSLTAYTLAINIACSLLFIVLFTYWNALIWIARRGVDVWNFLVSEELQADSPDYFDYNDAFTEIGLEPDDILSKRRRRHIYNGYLKKKEEVAGELRAKTKEQLESKINLDTIAKHIKTQVEDYVVNTVKDIRHLLR